MTPEYKEPVALDPKGLDAAFNAADEASPTGKAFAPGITAAIRAYLAASPSVREIGEPVVKEPSSASMGVVGESGPYLDVSLAIASEVRRRNRVGAPGEKGSLSRFCEGAAADLVLNALASCGYTISIAPQALASPPAPSGVVEALRKLANEYRHTMDRDVLHSWAGDVVAALAAIEEQAGRRLPTGIDLQADEKLGELIYRAMYEHEGGKWAAVETRYVWLNAAARLRAMLSVSPKQETE